MTITAPERPRTRQPKGIPVGGEFSPHARTEDDVDLSVPPVEETVWTKKYDTKKDKISAFREELNAAVDALDEDDNWNAYLEAMSKFRRYSLNNTLLIAMQRPDATRVASYNKWLELGRQVKKGEKGISIFAPMRRKVTDADDKAPATTGTADPEKKKATYAFAGYTTVTVFDVSQTEGEPLPEIQHTLDELPPEGFKEDLEAAIKAEGFTVDYEDNPGSTRGVTSADGSNRVVIQKDLDPGMEAKVLAHELGHIKAGHLDRIDEYHEGHSGCRGQMEVEAESIAYVLCRANGMESVADVSSTYVKGWAGRDADAMKKAGMMVANTVKTLLDGGTFRNAFVV